MCFVIWVVYPILVDISLSLTEIISDTTSADLYASIYQILLGLRPKFISQICHVHMLDLIIFNLQPPMKMYIILIKQFIFSRFS